MPYSSVLQSDSSTKFLDRLQLPPLSSPLVSTANQTLREGTRMEDMEINSRLLNYLLQRRNFHRRKGLRYQSMFGKERSAEPSAPKSAGKREQRIGKNVDQ
ncbi:hypothetical protein AVEN_41068-1 [Araneus ventricosus]|uniref:Uncharacterized protein n=1 Tax=Araneus ventricosus TaxID=182803 RepID=A0A4Y2CIT8_ARAVE|nr:hypothetical protein AVEN_41068-1 [Araneus ventricosus]